MSRKFLLATLGESPAVITEAVDLLTEQGVRPDGVILLHTEDPDVKASLELLLLHLPAHCRISDVRPVSVGSYGDIDSVEAVVEFMQTVCTQLKAYREHRLFVSITGGRKAMSALLTLATQFYGAERLFYIWVPIWMEEEGKISNLRNLGEDMLIECLHPRLDVSESDRPKLIDFPFISIFSMLTDILDALAGQNLPPKEIRNFLESAGLLSRDGEITALGKRVLEILEQIEMLPPARQEEPELHIPSDHHYAKRLNDFARRMINFAPYILRVTGMPWSRGQPGVHAQPPNELIVGVPLGTDILFRLQVVTTARTSGELEAARRHLERYILRQRR